jgi:superfamily II DNA helicase RecQ
LIIDTLVCRAAFGQAAELFSSAKCPTILFTASCIESWTDQLIQAWGLVRPLQLRGNTHRPNLRFQASHSTFPFVIDECMIYQVIASL